MATEVILSSDSTASSRNADSSSVDSATILPCLNLIEKRIQARLALGQKLSPVEKHLARHVRAYRKSALGPSFIAALGEIAAVFLRPLPIILVLSLVIASNVSSRAWLSTDISLSEHVFAPKNSEPPTQQEEDALAAQIEHDFPEQDEFTENPAEPQQSLQMQKSAAPNSVEVSNEELLAKIASAMEESLKKPLERIKELPIVEDSMPQPETPSVADITVQAVASLAKTELAAQSQAKDEEQRGLLAFITGVIAVYYPQIQDPGKMAAEIIGVSRSEGMDPLFVSSIIATESGFKSHAVSHKGAKGLMQLKPSTAQEVSQRHPMGRKAYLSLNEPEVNLQLGLRYLKELEQRYHGNRTLALAAYNWGPGQVGGAARER